MSKSKSTAKELSSKESPMVFWMPPRSSEMSEPSSRKVTPTHIREWLMSSRPDSRVNRSAMRENEWAQTIPATCGPQRFRSSVEYDRDSHSWRTCGDLFPADILEPSSVTWPKAGMIADGVFYPQPKWERRISVTGSGLWPTPTAGEHTQNKSASSGAAVRYTLVGMARYGKWPTPSATDHKGSGVNGELRDRLDYAVERGGTKTRPMFPTPRSRMTGAASERRLRDRHRNLERVASEMGERGQLNPPWVEWLMGWPIGWTDLKPLATGRFRAWL